MYFRSIIYALFAVLFTPQLSLADHLVDLNFPIEVAQTNPAATIPSGSPTPTGFAMVQVDTTANTISWNVSYQDLTGPIVAPGAHFHGPAPLGTNAGVQIFLSTGDPAEPATGTLIGSAPLTEDQQDDVLSGLWYLNIHTAMNESGELRGQVVNVPEPMSACLLASGIVGLIGIVCRRCR